MLMKDLKNLQLYFEEEYKAVSFLVKNTKKSLIPFSSFLLAEFNFLFNHRLFSTSLDLR